MTEKCPTCGAEMRKTKRGSGRRTRTAFICPVSESEVYQDEHGHYKRAEGALHPYRRVWTPEELDQETQL